MNSPSLRRKIVLILLLTSLVSAPWPAAGPRQESPRAEKAAASWLLEVVRHTWGFWLDFHAKEGCGIDPSGGCTTGASPAPPSADVEEGCYIDPDGCAAVQAKTGCYIDPDGLCRF